MRTAPAGRSFELPGACSPFCMTTLTPVNVGVLPAPSDTWMVRTRFPLLYTRIDSPRPFTTETCFAPMLKSSDVSLPLYARPLPADRPPIGTSTCTLEFGGQ